MYKLIPFLLLAINRIGKLLPVLLINKKWEFNMPYQLFYFESLVFFPNVIGLHAEISGERKKMSINKSKVLTSTLIL